MFSPGQSVWSGCGSLLGWCCTVSLLIQVIRPPELMETFRGLTPAAVIVMVASVGFGEGLVSSSPPQLTVANKRDVMTKALRMTVIDRQGRCRREPAVNRRSAA